MQQTAHRKHKLEMMAAWGGGSVCNTLWVNKNKQTEQKSNQE